jgi:hypothetical protein
VLEGFEQLVVFSEDLSAQQIAVFVQIPYMPAFGSIACGTGADHLGNDLALPLVGSEEVDSTVVAALGTLDLHVRHSGVKDVGEIRHVFLGTWIERGVPTCSSLV